MLREQCLSVRATHTRLEGRGQRLAVDVQQLVHPDQIEADHAGESRARGDQTAGLTEVPPPKRSHRHTLFGRPRQERNDLLVGARSHDRIGRVAQVAGTGAQKIRRRFAAST